MIKWILLCLTGLAVLGCTGQMTGTIVSFESKRPDDGKIKIKSGSEITIYNMVTNVRDFEDELLSFQNAKKKVMISYRYYPGYDDSEKRILRIYDFIDPARPSQSQ